MSETHPHDLDGRLDQAIDALNHEASPAPYEHGDHELFSLIDTARLMKSLRDPAEPDSGFAAQAVNRIAGEIGRMPATSNNGIPTASSPIIPAASVHPGRSKTSRRVRTWIGEVPELAAVLLVIFIVVAGIALSRSVFSGGSGESPATGTESFDPATGALGILSETPTSLNELESTPTPAATPIENGIEPIVERFRKTQAGVDFELAVPTRLDGFNLQEGALSVSGPPAAPAVNATFTDNTSQPFRMLGFAQRPGGFGDDPSREGHEAVPITIQGIETTLYHEPGEEELPILRVRWEMNGIHYDVGATNVEEEQLLEILNSIVPLSEIDGVGEPTPSTSGPDAPIEDPVEFVLTYLQAEGLQGFDPARGTFAGWLFTIARRRIADRGRSRARFRKLVERVRPQEPEAREEDVLDTTIRPEDALLARQLLATLSGRDREQVLPRYSAGMNSAEIADALGMRSGRLIASSEDGYGASIRSYSIT